MSETLSETIPKLLTNDYLAYKLLQKSTDTQHNESILNLLNKIQNDKEKTNDMLFIISSAYDKVYKKYNRISLSILILSSIVTLIEAIRLTIADYINKSQNLNVDFINFLFNLVTLSIGTIITIFSSYVRFKNYREILEQLKDKQTLLINYRDKYSKKYEKVLNLLAFDNLSKEDIRSINEKIIEYDNDIKTINVLEYLRNEEILRFNKYKATFEFELRKIDIDKELAIQNYEQNVGLKYEDIAEKKKRRNIHRFISMKRLKQFLLSRKSESNEDINVVVQNV